MFFCDVNLDLNLYTSDVDLYTSGVDFMQNVFFCDINPICHYYYRCVVKY